MTTFRINKYIYLHKNTPTPQGLVSSGMDRDASEWTKYPNSPLQLAIDTLPSGGAKISLRFENTSLEYLDTEEIDERFGATYGKKNPPLVAICKQPGIGFKYLVRRFHTMTYRFQIKFAAVDEYERAVELLAKTGVAIRGQPPKSTPTGDTAHSSFKDFNPESKWNNEEDDADLTQIDPIFMSQPSLTQPRSTEPLFLSQTYVDTPGSSQLKVSQQSVRPQPLQSSQKQHVRPPSQSYQQHPPKGFSQTSTWKRPADGLSSLEASPVNSPPNSPKRNTSWKRHFTPADTDFRRENGMVSRGTQTEEPEWLADPRAMERHIVDVVQNPQFDVYVARIKELMKDG